MIGNRLVPMIVAVALFMDNMDSTVIATSLPAIAADIGTSPLTINGHLLSAIARRFHPDERLDRRPVRSKVGVIAASSALIFMWLPPNTQPSDQRMG